jgi:hypothetical protein
VYFDKDVIGFKVSMADSFGVHEDDAICEVDDDLLDERGSQKSFGNEFLETRVLAMLHDEMRDFFAFVDEQLVRLDDLI